MIWFYSCALLFILTASRATDTIFPNQTLKNGETIVSAGEIFELGFFRPRNSSVRYVGIWYKLISEGTVVWVANREIPVVDPTGMLKLNDDGSLQLLSVSKTVIWSSHSSKHNINPVAQLLDSGNLVVKDEITGDLIWQSFDIPGDTWLPGMKIGVDLVTGIKRNLTSWKTSDNPLSGSYTVSMDINGYPQLYIQHKSYFGQRLGYWNGLGFTGMRGIKASGLYTFDLVLNQKEIYSICTLLDSSILTRIILNPQGNVQQLVWSDREQSWILYTVSAWDDCDRYALCGTYGRCSINDDPGCACLEGFEPKVPEDWSINDWSGGCKHEISVTRESEHNFTKFMNLKFPDSQDSWFNSTMSLGECQNLCARNISCTAYANIDIRYGGSGCLLWFSELIDIREASYGDGSGQDIFQET